ncbi:EAL domain-containing protein [Cryobacterium sp. MDB1-18-2]|uniref:EAL domain-containing protein n=2 Tax=Microbacteriaceae TaxID=85023 RepID=A0ABY2ILH8_9MICO|nr:EAL domain-containing protein [Cryobacterium sp. MDB2-A-1]TFC09155.1 EAL domain-containing protein [Cryobacterium sp. MDB2-A-2]TFC18039.1 EAL domain-containing protein [Cryobacterium glucosi]TFC34173.1 EAL domain-containing protein [Cryobacterium sp. MDB1-18-2]TFC46450.1 EAL domain-containing protein [Cryobacterium sp. MDB1-18-1]
MDDSGGNRTHRWRESLGRFFRAELMVTFHPGMFDNPKVAGLLLGSLTTFASLVLFVYVGTPEESLAPHAGLFVLIACVSLPVGLLSILFRRFFTRAVRMIVLTFLLLDTAVSVYLTDTTSSALAMSTWILVILALSYMFLPILQSLPFAVAGTVLVTTALFVHPGMRGIDLLLIIPAAIIANFGLHWLVTSALKSETDDLTRLGNRIYFKRILNDHVRSAAPGDVTTVVLVDLDHFTLTNEVRQRSYGDTILIDFAARCTRLGGPDSGAVVARTAGDEFAILLPGMTTWQAEAAVEAMRADVHVFSAGIAGHEPGESASGLRTRVTEALSSAKRAGRGTTRVHGGHYATATAVGQAIANGEFSLVFQPIVDLRTRRAVGAEALLRWTHPTRGAISPAEFIPLCEASGAMPRLGDWIVHTAVTTASSWTMPVEPGAPPFYVSVNASGIELGDPHYADRLLALCAAAALPAGALKIELTESDYVVEYGAVHANMAQLQTSGIPIMIDDFGTGSSNLERLSEVRANVLKIDRRFISAIGCAADDAPLVQSILGLARGLGSSVIAEGVETDVQADWLEENACRFAQGYLFSGPVASADLAAVCAGLSARSAALRPE